MNIKVVHRDVNKKIILVRITSDKHVMEILKELMPTLKSGESMFIEKEVENG